MNWTTWLQPVEAASPCQGIACSLANWRITRRIIGFGVERADLRGVSVCRMFNQIIAGKSLPRHLSSDHDPLFRFHRWLANLRVLEVEEIKSIPYVPVSHPFVERLIGTIRREFLDHVLIWNAV